jgi:hypothetical protein
VSKVTLLGNSAKTEEITFTTETMDMEMGKEGAPYVYGDVPSEDAFRGKLEDFKARYEWEDAGTRELADYLLTVMPDPAKGPGLNELIKALDKRMKEGEEEKVDEELFYQAVRDTVPPHIEPFMMESIKNHRQTYRRQEEADSPEIAPNHLYRDFMRTNRSKRVND